MVRGGRSLSLAPSISLEVPPSARPSCTEPTDDPFLCASSSGQCGQHNAHRSGNSGPLEHRGSVAGKARSWLVHLAVPTKAPHTPLLACNNPQRRTCAHESAKSDARQRAKRVRPCSYALHRNPPTGVLGSVPLNKGRNSSERPCLGPPLAGTSRRESTRAFFNETY